MKNEKSQEVEYNKFHAKYIKIVKQKNVCDFVYLNFKTRNSTLRIGGNKYIKYRKVMRQIPYKKIWEFDGLEHTFYKEKEVIESDGEVHEYVKTGERNKRSLRKIFTDMRYLINNNFTEEDSHKQLFITLTYAENMTDDKKLYTDFKYFFDRLKTAYKDDEFGYIVIMEPQGRGAWHCHLLLKTLNQINLYIPDEQIRKLWGHGITQTERLQSDNIGSYFVAYMSNAEVDDKTLNALEVDESDIKIKDGKKYLKGERLKFYPNYMKIYRNSKNMTKPEQIKMTKYDDPVDIAEEQYPQVTFQSVKEIETDKRPMIITKEQRRKPNKKEKENRSLTKFINPKLSL